jgi:membrane fusion protein (multidrug efflux system)
MTSEIHPDEIEQVGSPRKRAAKLIGIGLAVIAAVGGGIYYLHSRDYESTDNAFIEGDVIQVSPRIAGQMLRVYVRDNQHVNGGDLIAEIDASDYEARAAEASARLADAAARADGAQSNLLLTSTVTDAVLTEAGAAAGAAQEQV